MLKPTRGHQLLDRPWRWQLATSAAQSASPETDVVPGAELVAGIDQPADPSEPMLLVQPDAGVVGQGDHGYDAAKPLAAQAAEQLGVESVAHPATLPRGIDIDGGLDGP